MTRSRPATWLTLFVVILFTAACAAGAYEPLSQGEQDLRQQSTDLTTKTVAEGAAVGAILGGLIGGLAGGSFKSAAIGAGIGGVVGGAGGYYVAKQQQQYANQEARVDAMIADVRGDNQRLRQYASTAEQVIAADRQKLEQLNAQYAKSEISRSEAEAKLARIKENRDVIQETLASLREKKNEYAHAAAETRNNNPSGNLGELDRQIAMLEGNITGLERDLDSLNDALEVSPLGVV